MVADNRFGVPTLDRSCDDSWQITKSRDVGIQDMWSNESLSIAGADINVYKLLGVHEQGQMVDLAGNGVPISGGTAYGNNELLAFKSSNGCSQWRSLQQGSLNILRDAFIGYNFGVPKLSNGRDRYGVNIDVTQHITTIKLKHSINPNRRALKLRIERSDDGNIWKGVAIVTTENNDLVQTINFKQSAPSRYWRLRPLSFTGTDSDFWEISSIELIDWAQTDLFNVQDDFGWIENRDRDYATTSIKIKAFYDVTERESDLTRFGFGLAGGIFNFIINFNDLVNRIGRPIVIGDILEVPSEAQYDPNMVIVKKYLEVTDVCWSAQGYLPGWQPSLLKVTAEPMLAKQETMDIVGDFAGTVDKSGLFDIDDSKYSKIHKTSDIAVAKAKQDMPFSGADISELKTLEKEEIAYYDSYGIETRFLSVNQNMLYVEDAVPPNGAPYTEGPEFPLNPKHNDYHRMTYAGMADNIPARLFRYSSKLSRWVFKETDLRSQYSSDRPSVDKLLTSKNAISMRDIGKKDK